MKNLNDFISERASFRVTKWCGFSK